MKHLPLCHKCCELYRNGGFNVVDKTEGIGDKPEKCAHCSKKHRIFGYLEQVAFEEGGEESE